MVSSSRYLAFGLTAVVVVFSLMFLAPEKVGSGQVESAIQGHKVEALNINEASVVSSAPQNRVATIENQRTPAPYMPARIVDAGSALASLQAPPIQLSELLDRHLRAKPLDRQTDIDLLAAISYCANTRNSMELARNLRSSGRFDSEIALRSLERQSVEHSRYCRSIGGSDYLRRVDLLAKMANDGDAEAMTGYFEVGPYGIWDEDVQKVPLESAAISQWHAQSVNFLTSAVKSGKLKALASLSDAFAVVVNSQPDVSTLPVTDILANQRNPVIAYAYGLIYAEVLRSSNVRASESYSRGTLARLERSLTEVQRAEAFRLIPELTKQFK